MEGKKYEKVEGVRQIHVIYLIFFVLVLVLEKRKFVRRLFDTHSRTSTSTTTRTIRRKTTKAVHLTSVICHLSSVY